MNCRLGEHSWETDTDGVRFCRGCGTIQNRYEDIIEKDRLEKEVMKANIEFGRLPHWKQAVLEGDRLNDGSDEQSYEEAL
jgi:hypothetical protein